MPDPMDEEFTRLNPIVAAAMKLRTRRDVAAAIGDQSRDAAYEDAEAALEAFAAALNEGAKRLNAILRNGEMKIVRLMRPLRVRVRFRDKRIALDLDEVQQLVHVSGDGLDGEYQFVPEASVPSLIDISKISTEAGYGEALTSSALLQHIARDARLEPPHTAGGPLQF